MAQNLSPNFQQLTNLYLMRGRKQRGTAIFVLSREFRVSIFGHTITVPANFETDFSSVPRGFRWLVSVVDGIEGSVIHDFLYRIGHDNIDRDMADRILTEIDKESVKWYRRIPKWIGVRVGGAFTWNKARSNALGLS